MKSRRNFLKDAAISGTALALTGTVAAEIKSAEPIKNRTPRRAAVVWYSQAGHTGRVGRLIAARWKKAGLHVDAADYRDFDPAWFAEADLVAAGSPVFYYEVPLNFRKWLAKIPAIRGVAAAAFVTFGGEGGNQYNTVCGLMELLSEKGAVPVGIQTFGNMSTFSPTWSSGNTARVLKYRHLPDESTYRNIRAYADLVLGRVKEGKPATVKKKFDFRESIRGGVSIWGTKLLMSNFTIDQKKCINCGTCVEKCPSGAVDLDKKKMDSRKCIACMGCVNNCPAGAVNMTFWGRRMYGFGKLLKDNGVSIREPEELSAKA